MRNTGSPRRGLARCRVHDTTPSSSVPQTGPSQSNTPRSACIISTPHSCLRVSHYSNQSVRPVSKPQHCLWRRDDTLITSLCIVHSRSGPRLRCCFDCCTQGLFYSHHGFYQCAAASTHGARRHPQAFPAPDRPQRLAPVAQCSRRLALRASLLALSQTESA